MRANVDLEAKLRRRLRAVRNPDVETTMALAVAGSRLTAFAVTDEGVRFDPTLRADVTFTFDCAQTAIAVLTGAADPVAAFMDGRFRSDGHLPLVFTVLGLFQHGIDPTPPP